MKSKLIQIPEVNFFPSRDISENSGPIITFNIKKIHAFDISELLSAKGICIRSGHHCAQPILNKFDINLSCSSLVNIESK